MNKKIFPMKMVDFLKVDMLKKKQHYINIFLNGEDIRYLDGLNTVAKDGDEVSIVPAVAGGY